MLVIIDLTHSQQISKEIRAYFGGQDVAPLVKSSVIIIGSGLSKIVGKLFLKFSNPQYPTRIFSNREKAIAWLLEHKNKA